MKLATKLNRIIDDLYGWNGFHTEWGINFDSYALRTPAGVVFVDPLKPTALVVKKLDRLGEPVAILLTNANHDRDADWFRKRYGVQIYAHEKAQGDCDTNLDVLVLDDEQLPGDIQAIYLDGVSAGCVAFHSRQAGGILMIGDAVLNLPTKGLALLPDQYLDNRKLALRSLQKLAHFDFRVVTFAHGNPLMEDAKKQISVFLKGLKKDSK
jgi:hypothetical protein